MDDLTRRDVLKLGAAATVAASISVPEALAQPAATFFTPAEFTLVDELSELIIPADEHAPGARAAKVAAYIDARLAEAQDPADQKKWRDGLALVDTLSRNANGKPFMQASPDERIAVLTRMAQHEDKPTAPEEAFFVGLKSAVVHAYYTSEIGIKQELEYKGNTYLAEFVGVDVSK